MKKILLLFLFLALRPLTSPAQVKYGAEATLNVSNYTIKTPGLLVPTTFWVPGFSIGGLADYSINDNISLQPGLFFAINGIKYSYTIPFLGSADFSAHINTIQIPVNVQYKFGDAAGNRFFVGAGPFFAVNLSGSAKANVSGNGLIPFGIPTIDSSASLKVGSDSSDYIKRFDFGVGVNGGYELKNGLFFRLHGQLGLLNLQPKGNASNSIKSMNYNVSVGYWLGKKSAKKDKYKTKGRKR